MPSSVLTTMMNNGIPEVTPEELHNKLSDIHGKVRLIDVRNPDEFTGELGHVPGAELVVLGPALMAFLQTEKREQEIVFICRSGGRSGQATRMAHEMGFSKSVNMMGGMLFWNQLGFGTEK